MNRKNGGFIALLLVVALLAVACGPTMATPTPAGEVGSGPTTAATAPQAEKSPTAASAQEPTAETVPPSELPVSEEDWHVLGPADAVVTMIEYSDFQ